MRKYQNKNQLLILCLVVGFLIGILYENIVSGTYAGVGELFSQSNLQRYLQIEIIAEKYLWYVVQNRVLLLAICCLLGCMKWKKLYAVLCLTLLGFLAGSFTVGAVLSLGAKGILLCLTGVFPQGIFYGLVYGMLFLHWYHYPQRRWNRTKFGFVVFMFLAGILVETYINPLLLKWVIQIL